MAAKKTVTDKTESKKDPALPRFRSLRPPSAFSNKHLLVFIAIFVLIGLYVLWHAFAAGPLIASSEFEQWQWSSGSDSPQIYSDSSASGGKALTFPKSSEVTKFISLPSTATSLTIVAKQTNNCGSLSSVVPVFKLYIDNKAIGSKQIVSTSWAGYNFNWTVAAVGEASNAHTMIIDVTNGGQYTFAATTPGASGVSTDRPSATQVKPPPSCINSVQFDVFNFFGSTTTTPPPVTSTNCTVDTAWPASNQDLATQLMDTVNDYRTGQGLASLASSPQLTASAEWKARQMAYYNPGSNFLHNDTSPPISRPWYQRINDCGYNHSLCTSACTLHLDENLSEGSQQAVQDAFNNWLNSPDNKANINSTAMAQTGIGVAVSQKGIVYIVEDFGALIPDISQTITSSGSWVAPAGVHWVQAECYGAGGGGNSSGNGGGGGAYAKRAWVPVTPGKSYPVTAGNGGSSGNNGGASSFIGDDGTSCLASGGQGGQAQGGAGGAVANSIGDPGAVFAGGRGGSGSTSSSGGSTIATDDFNRPDSNPVDGNWDSIPGYYPMQIISDQLAITNTTVPTDCNTVTNNYSLWKDTLSSDIDVEYTIPVPGRTHEPAIISLLDTSMNLQLHYAIYPVDQTIYLSGVTDPILTFPYFPATAGSRIGLKITGTTVDATLNGSVIYERTLLSSSLNPRRVEFGSHVECFRDGSGGLRLDDFSVTSFNTTSTAAGGGEGACSTQAGHDGTSSSGGSGCDGGDGGYGQQAAATPGGGGAGGAANNAGGNGEVVLIMAADPYLEQTPDGMLYYNDQSGDGFWLVPDSNTTAALGLGGGAPTSVSDPTFVDDGSSTTQYTTLQGVSSGTPTAGGYLSVTKTIDSTYELVNSPDSDIIVGPGGITFKKVRAYKYEQVQAPIPPDCSLQNVVITSSPAAQTGRAQVFATGTVHCENGRKIIMSVDVCLQQFYGRGVSWVTSLGGCKSSGVFSGQNYNFSITTFGYAVTGYKYWRVSATGAASNLDGGEIFIDESSLNVPLKADVLSWFR